MKQIIFWGKAFSLIILMALYSCSNEVLFTECLRLFY